MRDEIETMDLAKEMIKTVIPAFIVFGIALLCTLFWIVRWIFACCCCCCCKKNKNKNKQTEG